MSALRTRMATVPVRLRDLTPADVGRFESNIIAVWRRATADQRARGRRWYADAHDLAAAIAGGQVQQGAGVIAALSAQCPWERNLTLARAACAGLAVPSTGERVTKVRRILSGEDPRRVLPEGAKTGHFYRCIADPGDRDAVVIDRHAHDLAVGARHGNANRGLDYRPRYELLAGAYRRVADHLGVRPSVLQATTWLVWTEWEAAR